MKKIMIEVGGMVYPCHLTMGAMLLFKQNTGKEMADMDAHSIEEMLMLLWCCIVSTCRGDHVDFDISFEEFADLVTPETIGKWNTAIAEASAEQKKTEP